MFDNHLARIRQGIREKFGLDNIAEWVVKNTKLANRPFSFKGHEFQEAILSDKSPEKIIRKCSQVGLTELTFRETLAILRILDGTTGHLYAAKCQDSRENRQDSRRYYRRR
jgi:hypothetical protein